MTLMWLLTGLSLGPLVFLFLVGWALAVVWFVSKLSGAHL